jgi:plastocyanin
MRSTGLRVLILALLISVMTILTAFASEAAPTVEAVNEGGGIYGETHRWSPSSVTIASGGVVQLRNLTAVRHGVNWISPPAAPVCDSSVPVGSTEAASNTNWSGNCTFSQAGRYIYYCTVHGAAMSGTITVKNPGTPTATTGLQTEVSQTGAKLNGVVNPEGVATSYYFRYGPNSSMEQKIPLEPDSIGSDFADHAVSATLSALSPNTEYHFELVARYGASSTTVGAERVFRTSALQKPAVTTGEAMAAMTTATLNGVVNPEGQQTSYHFEYGLTAGYGQQTSTQHVAAQETSQSATASLTELLPGTIYHFRLVAENAAGPTLGADRTFSTTSPPPASPTPTLGPISPEPELAPLLPVFVHDSLKLAVTHRGAVVRGSLEVSRSGAGGRLEVDLLAKSASLARRGHSSKQVTVGRLVRASVSAGKVQFSIALNARGKSALRRHHRLALIVKIMLTPPSGNATTLTRSVVLHA